MGRIGIENRPIKVAQKGRLGDFEIDLVIGKDRQGALLTATDRAIGVAKIKKTESKDAQIVKLAVIELLHEYKPVLQTITSDNGKEFSQHQDIAKQLDIGYYFAIPYHSWERGANENMNGLVRHYFPKGTSFENITNEHVKYVENKLNNRLRKRLGFKTSNQVYLHKLLNQQKVAFMTSIRL